MGRIARKEPTDIMPDGNKARKDNRPHKLGRPARPGVGRYNVILPDDLVERLDALEGARSHHIERAVREYLERKVRL
jgi:hypothetical protein